MKEKFHFMQLITLFVTLLTINESIEQQTYLNICHSITYPLLQFINKIFSPTICTTDN
jgi:hypothetical protein